jgi:hypothetical protein
MALQTIASKLHLVSENFRLHELLPRPNINGNIHANIAFDVLPYFLFWFGVNYAGRIISYVISPTYRQLNSNDKALWASYVCSTIHAILITLIAISFGYTNGKYIWDLNFHPEFGTAESRHCLLIFVGYLAHDLINVLRYWSLWPGHVAATIHHTTGIIAFWICLYYNMAHGTSASVWIMEITTPFINFRWFMEKNGSKTSFPVAYMLNGLIMTVLWAVFRCCAYTYSGYYYMIVVWDEFSKLPMPLVLNISVSFVIASSLQWFWFSKIVRGLLKVIGGSSKQSSSKNA